jgi:hypothetical protein
MRGMEVGSRLRDHNAPREMPTGTLELVIYDFHQHALTKLNSVAFSLQANYT